MTRQPTMIQLSADERDLLAEAADEEGVSRSEVVRRALRLYLEERRQAVLSRQITQGYELLPEATDEINGAMAGARRMLVDPDLEW